MKGMIKKAIERRKAQVKPKMDQYKLKQLTEALRRGEFREHEMRITQNSKGKERFVSYDKEGKVGKPVNAAVAIDEKGRSVKESKSAFNFWKKGQERSKDSIAKVLQEGEIAEGKIGGVHPIDIEGTSGGRRTTFYGRKGKGKNARLVVADSVSGKIRDLTKTRNTTSRSALVMKEEPGYLALRPGKNTKLEIRKKEKEN